MIKTFNYLIQSLLIYIFFFIGRLIGLNLSRKFFSFIFSLIAPFFKSKKIIENNLNIYSKNITKDEREKIISSMWKNYGMTFIEYIFLNFLKKNKSHIKIQGEEYLENIIKKGKPVIFVSGHFANFELMSMEITKKNIPLAAIYRPLNNFFLNPFMEYLRKKYICKNQIKKGINGVRDAITYIKKGYSVALMIDQRVSEGEKVNFFNKPALTTTLPAQLAMKFDLSIVPVFIERTAENNFELQFQNEINVSNFKNKLELTIKLNRILEKMILKNPNQWIWTHNRWK
jgi:Kdo2-lipid IVA lauroyltransferase/acyltransferase